MENASKAFLIAGGTLIGVMLVILINVFFRSLSPLERQKQNEEKGITIPFEEIVENIKFRDNNDKTSKVAPLKQAEDAIYIDSSNMTIEEVAEKVIEIIKKEERNDEKCIK